MFSVRDADVERKLNRRNDSTSFQQTRKKLLSAKSCSGVTEWLVLTTSTEPNKKRDQECRARAQSIDSEDLVV